MPLLTWKQCLDANGETKDSYLSLIVPPPVKDCGTLKGTFDTLICDGCKSLILFDEISSTFLQNICPQCQHVSFCFPRFCEQLFKHVDLSSYGYSDLRCCAHEPKPHSSAALIARTLIVSRCWRAELCWAQFSYSISLLRS